MKRTIKSIICLVIACLLCTSVAQLQSRLAELGFYDAKVSGGYYQITQSAVRAFQTHNGLVCDGVAGQRTQEMLFSDLAVPVSGTPRPSPVPAPAKAPPSWS